MTARDALYALIFLLALAWASGVQGPVQAECHAEVQW